jgi:hypothetical protein
MVSNFLTVYTTFLFGAKQIYIALMKCGQPIGSSCRHDSFTLSLTTVQSHFIHMDLITLFSHNFLHQSSELRNESSFLPDVYSKD